MVICRKNKARPTDQTGIYVNGCMSVSVDSINYIYTYELTAPNTLQEMMSASTFESLPADVIFSVFQYLSPAEIIHSFLAATRRLAALITREYLWHINIDTSTMSLVTLDEFQRSILKTIGRRVVSLRLTLTNAIGGWALVSPSLRYHRNIPLQRLHLIDIEPHEFDRLLRSQLIKQLHTLLVHMTKYSLFNEQTAEGPYLAKVCT